MLFGVGGAILGALVFPVLRLGPASEAAKVARVQRLVHLCFRAFVRYMRTVDILEIDVRGAAALRRPAATGRLIVANHPTLLDVVLLVSRLPQADCIVKRALFENPFLRHVVRGAGYLPNDTGPELIAGMSERLRQGRTLLLFPEGTRSPMRSLGSFQRGAAHAALETGCEVVPVTVRCEPPSLMRGQPWWDVPPRRMHFEIEVCEPWSEVPATDPELGRGLVARALTDRLRDFFVERVIQARA